MQDTQTITIKATIKAGCGLTLLPQVAIRDAEEGEQKAGVLCRDEDGSFFAAERLDFRDLADVGWTHTAVRDRVMALVDQLVSMQTFDALGGFEYATPAFDKGRVQVVVSVAIVPTRTEPTVVDSDGEGTLFAKPSDGEGGDA